MYNIQVCSEETENTAERMREEEIAGEAEGKYFRALGEEEDRRSRDVEDMLRREEEQRRLEEEERLRQEDSRHWPAILFVFLPVLQCSETKLGRFCWSQREGRD